MNELKTGAFVWVTGRLDSDSIPRRMIKLTETMIVGKTFDSVSPTGIYKFIDEVTYEKPISGLILGWSNRYTGSVREMYGGGSYDPPEPPEYQGNYLEHDGMIKVWIVMPLGKSINRYYTPIVCLAEHLTVIE